MSSRANKFILIGILIGLAAGIAASFIWSPQYNAFQMRLPSKPAKEVKIKFLYNGADLKLKPVSLRFTAENWQQMQKVEVTPLTKRAATTPISAEIETADSNFAKSNVKKIKAKITAEGNVFLNVKRVEKPKVYDIVVMPVEPLRVIKWLGDFFLNALRMLIVPLIIFSMVAGITSLGDIRRVGGIGGKTIAYYLTTTMIAVVIGVILVNIIQPGVSDTLNTEGLAVPDKVKDKGGQSIGGAISQIISGIISPNIIKSMVELQIVPLIVFSLFLGGVLSTLGEKARPVVNAFQTLNDAILKMVGIFMYIAPIGVFALVAYKFGSAEGEGFLNELKKIGFYSMTVIVGLAIQALVVLPLVLKFLGKRDPFKYLRGMGSALSTAFATASSSATLPVTLECVEENNKIPNKSASFVLPLGATINMDGTALYEAVAAIFIAQAYGIDLTIGQQIIIFITANLAAIGAAGIPQAGLTTMVLVLQAVNLPLEGMALILAIDWFLDRFRTTVNVWGDAVGAAVIAETPEVAAT